MIDLEKILHANSILQGVVRPTPLLSSEKLNQRLGFNVWFKDESQQHGGSFKIRGAYYCMHQQLMQNGPRDVVAGSSGNHAQGVALAGSLLGLKTTIVMPSDAPVIKVTATKKYGAEIIFYDRYKESREQIAKELAEQSNAYLIPAYDHEDVIAGQSSVGIEAIQQMQSIDLTIDNFICQVGGGGLIAGSCLAFESLSHKTAVYGVEPEYFNDTQQSLSSGKRVNIDISKPTICDALMVDTPGEITFPINQRLLKDIFSVEEQYVIEAMKIAYRELDTIIEPSGVIGLAMLLKDKFIPTGDNTIVVLSGGNIDPSKHQDLIK